MNTCKLCEPQRKIHNDKMLSAFWEELLENGSPMFNEEIEIKIKNYQLDLDMTVPYIIVVFSVKDGTDMPLRNEENLIHCIFRFKNTGFFRISQKLSGIIIPMERNMDIADIAVQCDEYIRFMYEVWERKVFVLMGQPLYMDKLTAHFNQILDMERQIVGSHPKIYMYETVDKQPKVYNRPPFELWKVLLERGLYDRVLEEITGCLFGWENMKQTVLALFLQDFDRMIYSLESMNKVSHPTVRTGDKDSGKSGGASSSELYWARYDSIDGAINYITSEIHQLKSLRGELWSGREDAIESVCAYVQSHMDEPISRKILASYVHLNEDYLGKLFHKKRGISLKDYIIREKMLFAKDLLTKTNMSVSEAALCTGFHNFSYFSTVFKKVNGFTPGSLLAQRKNISENQK